jgi:arylsulfatase A-like enzyme
VPRTNILLITSDQQHFSTLGVVNPKISTPNLDGLAAAGTLFDRAYCPNPVCSPSRASIITGMYPSVHECWTIGVKLPEDVPTVGAELSKHGYATALIGKAHFHPTRSTDEHVSLESMPILRDLDFWRGFHGPWYGFDHIELARNHGDETLVGQHYAIWLEEQGCTNWRDYFGTWPPDGWRQTRLHHWDLPQELHYTRWTADRTISCMERFHREDKPFFLWASFQDPHPPYLVSSPWDTMYDPADMEPGRLVPNEHDRNPPHFGLTQQQNPDFSGYQETEFPNHGLNSHLSREERLRKNMAVYYGMVSFMDQQIGRILNSLDQLGLAENTLVVFTTDHGHFLGQHGLIRKGPFHYEDMLRLPFIARLPGRVPAGQRSSALQSLVDLAPTFLATAGIEVPGYMQGVNQLPVWVGEKDTVCDHVLVENRHQPTAVHLRTFVNDRYKITVYRDHPYGELFDLHEDPGEVNNLWDDPGSQTLKGQLLHAFVNAYMVAEPTRMPRISNA